jgi:hypothetical protein
MSSAIMMEDVAACSSHDREPSDSAGHNKNEEMCPLLLPEADGDGDLDEDDDLGPSSVEAQADPNDLSYDLDLDLPTPTYPLVSPQPSTSNDIFNVPPTNDNNESNPFADLFDGPNLHHPILDPDVKVEGAVAGVCGFYNFANTCYMNSGLQCLLATPSMVKYFSNFDEGKKEDLVNGLIAKFR